MSIEMYRTGSYRPENFRSTYRTVYSKYASTDYVFRDINNYQDRSFTLPANFVSIDSRIDLLNSRINKAKWSKYIVNLDALETLLDKVLVHRYPDINRMIAKAIETGGEETLKRKDSVSDKVQMYSLSFACGPYSMFFVTGPNPDEAYYELVHVVITRKDGRLFNTHELRIIDRYSVRAAVNANGEEEISLPLRFAHSTNSNNMTASFTFGLFDGILGYDENLVRTEADKSKLFTIRIKTVLEY